MKNFKSLIIGLGLSAAFILPACGNGPLDEMESAKDKVCACKDAACVAKIKEETKGLDEKMKKLSEEDQKKANAIAMEAFACMSKLSN